MADGESTKSKGGKSAKFDDAFCENLSSFPNHCEEEVSLSRRIKGFEAGVEERQKRKRCSKLYSFSL